MLMVCGCKRYVMYRGGCLPVRASECVNWNYEREEECGCRERKTMEHVLLSEANMESLEQSGSWLYLMKEKVGWKLYIGIQEMSEKSERVIMSMLRIYREKGIYLGERESE